MIRRTGTSPSGPTGSGKNTPAAQPDSRARTGLALNEVGHANPDEGYARTLRHPATKQRATASRGSGLRTTNDGSRGQNNTEPAVITVPQLRG